MPPLKASGIAAGAPETRAGPTAGAVLPRPEPTPRARSRRELVIRRFLRHRVGMGALVVFGAVVILAFTSIGVAGLPGWWPQSYTATSTVTNGGRMTLDLLPSALGGHG